MALPVGMILLTGISIKKVALVEWSAVCVVADTSHKFDVLALVVAPVVCVETNARRVVAVVAVAAVLATGVNLIE